MKYAWAFLLLFRLLRRASAQEAAACERRLAARIDWTTTANVKKSASTTGDGSACQPGLGMGWGKQLLHLLRQVIVVLGPLFCIR